VAVDLRGHGETVTADDKDMSSATRVADIAAVWESLFGEEQPATGGVPRIPSRGWLFILSMTFTRITEDGVHAQTAHRAGGGFALTMQY
jgi:hypothetical protein